MEPSKIAHGLKWAVFPGKRRTTSAAWVADCDHRAHFGYTWALSRPGFSSAFLITTVTASSGASCIF